MLLKSITTAIIFGSTAVTSFAPSPHITIPTSLSAHTDATENRRTVLATLSTLPLLPLIAQPQPASARLEGVNKPELLPSEPGLNVIQVERFLTKGQEKRLSDLLTALEKDTGYRVRVLCQAYPRTPGLAIRDYWDLGKEVKEILIGDM